MSTTGTGPKPIALIGLEIFSVTFSATTPSCQVKGISTSKPKTSRSSKEKLTLIFGKGKLYLGSYVAEAKDCDGNAVILSTEGSVEVPYISDENAGEDPVIKISIKDDGPVGKALKEVFIAKGKPFLLEKIREFVDAMAKGGPAKDEVDANKVAMKKLSSGSAVKKNNAASNSASGAKEIKHAGEKRKHGFNKIKMIEKFSCRAKDLYEILMDENRWKGFTQSNARINKEVGGEFSIFDGSVTGRNVELQEGKLIVQKWRFGSWPDDVVSMVRLTFDELESGVTVVKLTHTDVPEEDRYGNATVVENTERGWRDLIFQRIRAVFGFKM